MTEPTRPSDHLRRYRALADRYLSLVAKEHGMHPTDTNAISQLLDQHNRGKVITAGELGELLTLSGPATTAAIDRLERHGIVERRQSSADGRRVEVHLGPDVETNPARSMFADMSAAVDRVAGRHTAAERAVFETILNELCDEIDGLNQQRSQRR